MQIIKNLELLPDFFKTIRMDFNNVEITNGKLIIALMSDYLPNEADLKRCVKIAYDSNAIEHIMNIRNNPNKARFLRNKAIERIIGYSFMDQQTATSIIDALIKSICFSEEEIQSLFSQALNLYNADNYEDCLQQFEFVSILGYSEALYFLASCYGWRMGKKELMSAEEYYDQALSAGVRIIRYNGDITALFQIGDLHFHKGNYSKAIKWYKYLDSKGWINNHSTYNFGDMFYQGLGIEQDYTMAVKCFSKAAFLDNESARDMLYKCYSEGLGVPKRTDIASIWKRINDFEESLKDRILVTVADHYNLLLHEIEPSMKIDLTEKNKKLLTDIEALEGYHVHFPEDAVIRINSVHELIRLAEEHEGYHSSDAVKEKIIEIICNNLDDIDTDNLHMTDRLVEDLGVEDLDIDMILMDCEDEFDCAVSDQDRLKIVTVEDLVNYFSNNMI